MTMHPRDHDDARDAGLPDALAAGLRGLGGDVAPARDLWPAIAARLEPRAAADPRPALHPHAPALSGADTPTGAPVRRPAAPRRGWRPHHRRRGAAYASAAALVLAIVAGWQLLPVPGPSAPVTGTVARVPDGAAQPAAAPAAADVPLLRAADALAREYQGALREVEAARGGPSAATADLGAELERSAAEVRAALARDPDALHLLHRLQRVYAHRLALSLRQA